MSKTRDVVNEAEPPAEVGGRESSWLPRSWLPILWLPILWLSVWCGVVGLVAWERYLASDDLPVAQLGWLPVFVASLVMSLYMQWQRREARPTLRPQLLYVRLIHYLVWIVIVWYLGGWETSLLGLLVLLAGELQGWMLQQPDGSLPDGPVPDGSLAESFSNVGKKDETPLESPRSNLSEEMVTEVPKARAVPPAGQTLFAEELDRGIEADDDHDIDHNIDRDIDQHIEEDIEADDDQDIEADDEERDDDQTEAEGAADTGNWRQQMTRRVWDLGAELLSQPDESEVREQIEWFGRHDWRAGQVQVDLHVPFQPAFLEAPEVQVAVVEGMGEASVGDVLPHGTRVQLKRGKLEENSIGATVVWLQVTGPVEP